MALTNLEKIKETLKNIGNAVREKNGKSYNFSLKQLPKEILDLEKPNTSLLKKIIERTEIEITAEDLEGVTSIADYAFYGFDILRYITLPKTITSIGNYAFAYCDLKRIKFNGTIEQWNNVSKGTLWAFGILGSIKYVTCIDGTVDI